MNVTLLLNKNIKLEKLMIQSDTAAILPNTAISETACLLHVTDSWTILVEATKKILHTTSDMNTKTNFNIEYKSNHKEFAWIVLLQTGVLEAQSVILT